MTTITGARFDSAEEAMLDYLFQQVEPPGMTADPDANTVNLYFIPVVSGQESAAGALTAEFTLPTSPTDRESWMPTNSEWTIASGGLEASTVRDTNPTGIWVRTASAVTNNNSGSGDITYPIPSGASTGCTVPAVLMCIGKYGDATKLLPLKLITLTNPLVVPSGGGPAPSFAEDDLVINWK